MKRVAKTVTLFFYTEVIIQQANKGKQERQNGVL